MRVPVTYIVRNLAARRLTTILTAGGMALVVYVFATVLMLSAGLEATLVATGQDDNVVVIAMFTIVFNLIVDVLYAFVDPRVRYD